MCDTIELSYPSADAPAALATREYDPETAGHTCTCELADTPSAPADPQALSAFGRWLMQQYREIRQEVGDYDPIVHLRIH